MRTTSEGSRSVSLRETVLFVVSLVVFLVPPALLLKKTNPLLFLEARDWFDPFFFQYNLVLLLVFVLMVPVITYVFVTTMQDERLVRLRKDLTEAQWQSNQEHIQSTVRIQFGLRSYIGGTLTLTVIIALGLSVTLLLKPVPTAEGGGSGVNYGKGANLLLLGPYIKDRPDTQAVYDRVILSITAFQFGFLGAYVFFIGHLVRSYFTLDLSPSTFVSISVRMVVSSLVALVLSFGLPLLASGFESTPAVVAATVPVVSFFIGFFPTKGLMAIDNIASKILGLGADQYAGTALSVLRGMSAEHEIRLRREGFDNVENLAQAEPIGLAIRTGFRYPQLREWIGEAWLRLHLGADYEAFHAASGISSVRDLGLFLGAPADPEHGARLALLERETVNQRAIKIQVIARIAEQAAAAERM